MQFSHTNEVVIFKVSKKLFKINASNLWSIFYLNMKEGCFPSPWNLHTYINNASRIDLLAVFKFKRGFMDFWDFSVQWDYKCFHTFGQKKEMQYSCLWIMNHALTHREYNSPLRRCTRTGSEKEWLSHMLAIIILAFEFG